MQQSASVETDPVSPKVFEIAAHFYDDEMEDENENHKPKKDTGLVSLFLGNLPRFT